MSDPVGDLAKLQIDGGVEAHYVRSRGVDEVIRAYHGGADATAAAAATAFPTFFATSGTSVSRYTLPTANVNTGLVGINFVNDGNFVHINGAVQQGDDTAAVAAGSWNRIFSFSTLPSQPAEVRLLKPSTSVINAQLANASPLTETATITSAPMANCHSWYGSALYCPDTGSPNVKAASVCRIRWAEYTAGTADTYVLEYLTTVDHVNGATVARPQLYFSISYPCENRKYVQ